MILKMTPRNIYTADQSALILASRIRKQIPTIFVRFGDGAMECIKYRHGKTCDGELYSFKLAEELIRVWKSLFLRRSGDESNRSKRVVIGDWMSASFIEGEYPYDFEYETLFQSAFSQDDSQVVYPFWVHFESILMMRETGDLLEFWKSIIQDPRKKLLIGPTAWFSAAKQIHAEFIPLPITSELFPHWTDQIKRALDVSDAEVVLYGAGMAGNIPIIDNWICNLDRTYINVGSGLDPIFRGHTRRQQLNPVNAKKFWERIVRESNS